MVFAILRSSDTEWALHIGIDILQGVMTEHRHQIAAELSDLLTANEFIKIWLGFYEF